MFTAHLTKDRSRLTVNIDAPTETIARACIEIAQREIPDFAPGHTIADVHPLFHTLRVARRKEGRKSKLVVQANKSLIDTDWETIGDLDA